MRSSIADKLNPWPHDMVIRVNDDNELLTLLFLRHAWGLTPEVELPALDPVPEAGNSFRPSTASLVEWNRRWKDIWTRTWDWYRGTDAQRRPVQQTVLESSPWPHEEEPPESMLELWVKAQLRPDPMVPLEESPERRSLPALIADWKSGLETVTLLPYRGYYAERVSAKHLMVSVAARLDPASYSQALATGVA